MLLSYHIIPAFSVHKSVTNLLFSVTFLLFSVMFLHKSVMTFVSVHPIVEKDEVGILRWNCLQPTNHDRQVLQGDAGSFPAETNAAVRIARRSFP